MTGGPISEIFIPCAYTEGRKQRQAGKKSHEHRADSSVSGGLLRFARHTVPHMCLTPFSDSAESATRPDSGQ